MIKNYVNLNFEFIHILSTGKFKKVDNFFGKHFTFHFLFVILIAWSILSGTKIQYIGQ